MEHVFGQLDVVGPNGPNCMVSCRSICRRRCRKSGAVAGSYKFMSVEVTVGGCPERGSAASIGVLGAVAMIDGS